MRYFAIMAAMAALLFAGLPSDPAEARSRTYYSFSYSGGSIGVTVGRAPRYYYAPRRRYYQYYVPRRSYYRYRRTRARVYRRSGGSCGYWHNRCVANWGYGKNYRGCMRYHRC
ncbi:MAG: hypothetical protein AAGD23_03805 [Pseudomonadota bacterium]